MACMSSFTTALIAVCTYLFINISCEENLAEYADRLHSLYNVGGYIKVVNVTDFEQTVLHQENAWAVEFYYLWCGHCIRFARKWNELAHIVRAWHSVINVAAINCADEVNMPVCRQHEVTSFPSIKFFRANAVGGDLGVLYKRKKDVESLLEAMLDFVASKNASAPMSWPSFDPLSYLDMKSMWQDIPVNVSHAAIIVEEADSYVGKFVILDMLPYRRYIAILRATKESSLLIESFKEIEMPFMIFARRNGELKTFTGIDEPREEFVKVLRKILESSAVRSEDVEDSKVSVNTELQPFDVLATALALDVDLDRVYLQDFENTLYYILHQEVAIHKTIDGDRLDALKSFINVLAKYMPTKDTTAVFLGRLLAWLNELTTPSLTYEMIENKINEIQSMSSMRLKKKQWMGCRGSRPHLRGYTCGLWTTFHTLTVAAFIRHGKDDSFNPLEVVNAIRKYVMFFFGCQTCVEHFTEMSAHVAEEIKSREDSVLWLWQAHNRVNARLKGEPSDDPLHPKKQFPTPELCLHCQTDGDVGNQWDLTAVMEFLVSYYSGQGIVGWQEAVAVEDDVRLVSSAAVMADGSDSVRTVTWTSSPSGQESVKKRDVQMQRSFYQIIENSSVDTMFSRWSIGSSDISICVVLYIFSILLLLMCYFFILARRRKSLFSSFRGNKPFNFV